MRNFNKKKVVSFKDFKKTKIEKDDEISDISEEPEKDELADTPDALRYDDETKKDLDYYNVNQDIMTPKPFTKPIKKT
jgi:hypothetical protein